MALKTQSPAAAQAEAQTTGQCRECVKEIEGVFSVWDYP